MRRFLTTKTAWILCALLALNAFLLAAGPGFALVRPVANYVFGPKVVRAEVVVKEGSQLIALRVDRGRVRSVSDTSLTMVQADNSAVTIPLSPATRVILPGGRGAPVSVLRRGTRVETERVGDGPATVVRANRK